MNNDDKLQPKNAELIKKELAEYLGIEIGDLTDDDCLTDDLHMNYAEISDFLHLLTDKGIALNLSNISRIYTVQNIIDISSENEEL